MEKIAIAQTRSSGNWRQNSEKAEHFMKKAKAEQAKMIIFPEYFMNYYPDADHKYIEKAQTLYGDFVTKMKDLAKEYRIWIIFGMNEMSVDETKNYNTMAVIDEHGKLIAKYHKTHLFNAFNWQESKDTLEGDHFFDPVQTPAGKIGLGVCYDHYMGRSTGFGPDGRQLYQGEETEELLFAAIDLEQIKIVRKANPVFENRREDLYEW